MTTAGSAGSFGQAAGKTLYYLAGQSAGYESSLIGYTAVEASPFTKAPVPTITGTKKSGSTLTAVTGTWTPTGATVTYSYSWSRAANTTADKVTISGATSKTYKLTAADKGKYITVTVTASKIGYAPTARTSADGGTKIAS
jgi:hypothetical protein